MLLYFLWGFFMSLIGSVRDGLFELRKKSISQERIIDRHGEFSQWRMSDATGVSMVEKTIAVIALPVFLFWFSLLILFSLGMSISLISFNLLSRLFR